MTMRRVLGVVLLAALLSGCADADESDGPSISSPPTTGTSAANETTAPPIEVTDTLFLLRVPDVTLVPPTGSEPETTPYGFGDMSFGSTIPRWEYRAQAAAAPTGVESSIWIRVVEPLFVPPAQTPCTWSLEVYAGDEFAFPVMCSGPNGPNVMTGDYELKFSSSSPNQTAVEAGATWAFQLRRTAFSPTPNDAVLILVNAEDFPSHVKVSGLMEPKPTAT